MNKLLNVGCGTSTDLPEMFNDYKEYRLDIDPKVIPDFLCSMLDMNCVDDNSFDAIYSCHNIEHLFPQEIPIVMSEFKRVLKDTGFLYIRVPDFEEVCKRVLDGKIIEDVYLSDFGPIKPIDIIFGHHQLAKDNIYMQHHMAYTIDLLGKIYDDFGFSGVMGRKYNYDIEMIGFKEIIDERIFD